MDSDKSVTANFQGCQSSVRIAGFTPVYYQNIQAAYDLAEDGDVIETNAVVLSGSLIANRMISITVTGGYDCNYEAVIGDTSISGDMTINGGAVTIEHIILE